MSGIWLVCIAVLVGLAAVGVVLLKRLRPRNTPPLDGLTSLSDEVTTALAAHEGELSLKSLPAPSADGAEAVAEHPSCRLPTGTTKVPAAEFYEYDRITVGKPTWIEQSRFKCEQPTLMSCEDIGEEFNPGIEFPPGEWVVETAHLVNAEWMDIDWGERVHELRIRAALDCSCSEFSWPGIPENEGEDHEWREPVTGNSQDEVSEFNWGYVEGGSVVLSFAPASEEEQQGDLGRPELCYVRPSRSGFPRIVCQAGFGDGYYPIAGRYRNGSLVEVRIRFIFIAPPETINADAV